MRVCNMMSSIGNKIANQFLIRGLTIKIGRKNYTGTMFQSYDSLIAFRANDGQIFLDETYWDYSATTSKYRRIFLNGEGIAETRAKIKEGRYILADLNKA